VEWWSLALKHRHHHLLAEPGDPNGDQLYLALLTQYANASRGSGDANKAILLLEEAYTHAVRIGTPVLRLHILLELAECHLSVGRYHVVITELEHARTAIEKLGLRPGSPTYPAWYAARLANALTNAYLGMGKIRHAIRSAEYSLRLVREAGVVNGEGYSLQLAAGAYLERFEWSAYYSSLSCLIQPVLFNFRLGCLYRAHRYATSALSIARTSGFRDLEVYALLVLGTTELFAGWLEAGMATLRKAHGVAVAEGDHVAELRIISSLGAVYNATGRFEDAAECHQHCLALSRRLGDRQAEASALHNLSMVQLNLGKREAAGRNAREALPIFVEIGSPTAVKTKALLSKPGSFCF
jgi:tetratricopeptide (TPR) repeat protein